MKGRLPALRARLRSLRFKRLLTGLAKYIRAAPLTWALVAVIWTLALITGAVAAGPSAGVLGAVATGPQAVGSGAWWTSLTSPLWSLDLAGYVVITLLLVAVVGPVERASGTWRTTAVLILVQVISTVLASGAVLAAASAGDEWTEQLAGAVTVGAGPMAIGAGMAFTARLGALWRRRLRLITLMVVVVLVAYSGTLHDLQRLFAALIGLVLGPWLLGRSQRAAARTASWSERRVLVALVVAGTAVGPLVAALSDVAIGPLSVLRFLFLPSGPDAASVAQICADPSAVEDCQVLRGQLRLGGVGPAVMSAMPVLLLLAAADGLRRGRRAAWLAAFWLNLVLAGMGALLATELFGTPSEQRVVFGGLLGSQTVLAILLPLTVPLLVTGLLWRTRATFDVRTPRGPARRLRLVTAASLIVLAAVYVGVGWLTRNQFDRPPTVGQLLADLPTRFVPPGYLGEVNPLFLPVGAGATLLYEWTGIVWLLILAATLIVAFRRHEFVAAARDRVRAAGILRRHGGSSLSYLTVWAGNQYLFSANGRAYIAYRVSGAVAVSVTGPVGEVSARRDAVTEFVSMCNAAGLTPCLYSVPSDVRDDLSAALEWRSVQVAEETIVPLAALAFTGKRWQDVRTAVNKAAKIGVAAQWWSYPDAPLTLTGQIKAISEEWVSDKGLPEMGFTLGGLAELADAEVRCLIAVDAHQVVQGITSFLPVYRDGHVVGWTLDFMRRRTGGFPGVMEFLIATAALQFKEEGAEILSLSGAPLARIDRGGSIDPLQRMLDTVGRALEPVYGFRSLLDFKAKFQPVYEPLWMSYPDPAALPAIAAAIGRCYLPHISAKQGSRLLGRITRRHRPTRSTGHAASTAQDSVSELGSPAAK